MTDFLHFIFPGAPLSKEKKIAADILAALKGGEGSGNFGHAGRPGEVGGSRTFGSGFAKRAGINIPEGVNEQSYITAAIHGSRKALTDEDRKFLDDFRLPDQYETYGDYYHDVTLRAAAQYTIDNMTADFIRNQDKELLRELYLKDVMVAPIQFEFSGQIDVPEESTEWGLQKYGLRPVDLFVSGRTDWVNDNDLFGTVAKVSVLDNDRETLWHELGHVTFDHYVYEIVGDYKGNNQGDIYDKYAEIMSNKGRYGEQLSFLKGKS